MMFNLCTAFVVSTIVIESLSVLPFLELSENATSFSGVDDDTIFFNFPVPFHFNSETYSNGYVCQYAITELG